MITIVDQHQKTKVLRLLSILMVLLSGVATAAQVCGVFPSGIGTEQACISGIPESNQLNLGPGDTFRLPSVVLSNNTERPMRFTIESVGPSQINREKHTYMVESGAIRGFSNLKLFRIGKEVPIGTTLNIKFGFSMSGSHDNEPFYIHSAEQTIALEIGPDSDGDGLVDSWEINGVDVDGDGFIDVDLPSYGADPNRKDIFVELDWEVGGEPDRVGIERVKEAFAIAPRYAGGTLNPDGSAGIRLWVDTGILEDENFILLSDDFGGGNEIAEGRWTFGERDYICDRGIDAGKSCVKNSTDQCDAISTNDEAGLCVESFAYAKARNFNPLREGIFRYGISSASARGGQAGLGKNDFWIGSPSGDTDYFQYIFMHELGHTLNLSHGGDPAESGIRNCEPNYISSMNYRYSFIERADGSKQVDYAPAMMQSGIRASIPDFVLEEADLLEGRIIDSTDGNHKLTYIGPPEVCAARCLLGDRNGLSCDNHSDCNDGGLGVCIGIAEANSGASCSDNTNCGGGICIGRHKVTYPNRFSDWNLDGVGSENVEQNLDYSFGHLPGNCRNDKRALELTELPDSSLTPWNDWLNIKIPPASSFQTIANNQERSADIIIDDPFEAYEQFLQHLKKTSTVHLEIQHRNQEALSLSGQRIQLSYDAVVTNHGEYPVGTLMVQNNLPNGFSILDMDNRCSSSTPEKIECLEIGLPPGDSEIFSFILQGSLRCLDGVPEEVKNIISVENRSEFAGEDPAPGDSVSSFSIDLSGLDIDQLCSKK